jgi:hypothetical protein
LKEAEKQVEEETLQSTIAHLRAQVSEKNSIINRFQKSRG